MNQRTLFVLLLTVLSFVTDAFAKDRPEANRNARSDYPPVMEGAKVKVYKKVGDVQLNMYVFQPKEQASANKRPAIVFFFGGGWSAGSPKQFEKQCEYFASRGMVSLAADYRVASRHGVKAVSCVADAKSAIRWIRAHAEELGVDPEKIVASGGSAGGHIAACTGTIDGLDEAGEDVSLSSRPNAMVLFNPAVVLAPVKGELPLRNPEQLKDRTGIEPAAISPFHHIKPGAPPMLILHGKEDSTVPYKTVEWFSEAMTKAGNRCELAGYEGAGHGFFNYARKEKQAFVETLERADRFLASLGYLAGESTVKKFLAAQKSAD